MKRQNYELHAYPRLRFSVSIIRQHRNKTYFTVSFSAYGPIPDQEKWRADFAEWCLDNAHWGWPPRIMTEVGENPTICEALLSGDGSLGRFLSRWIGFAWIEQSMQVSEEGTVLFGDQLQALTRQVECLQQEVERLRNPTTSGNTRRPRRPINPNLNP